MHKDAQRKTKGRPRGGEGAGGAAPGKERAAGGTLTTGPCAINSPQPPSPRGFTDGLLDAPQPQAQNSPVENMLADRALHYAAFGDKTLGQHAQNGAQRLYAGDMMPNWSPNRDRPKVAVAPKKPSEDLVTPEQQEAFAQAVVDHTGIKPACETLGFQPSSVFYWAGSHPEFRKRLDAAQAAVFEVQVYKLNELCDDLLKMPPREMNQCANAYGRVFDYRMRIVGKLLPVLYGDRPGTQVNIQNNTGIVCNEATRERLIAINQKLLNVPTETKELEQ